MDDKDIVYFNFLPIEIHSISDILVLTFAFGIHSFHLCNMLFVSVQNIMGRCTHVTKAI